jgi:hypothetical protein
VVIIGLTVILAYLYLSKNNTNTGDTEGFQAAITTTKPIVIAERTITKQVGNLIATNKPNNQISFKSVNMNLSTGNTELPYKSEFQLMDTYVITQLRFKDLLVDQTDSSLKIRIAIRNTYKNDLQYVNFADLLVRDNKPIDTESMEYRDKTMQRTETDNLYKDNPTNIYGNQLIGDKLILYTDKVINGIATIYVYGYQEKDNYKASVYEQAQTITTTPSINVGYTSLSTAVTQGVDDYLITSFAISKTSTPGSERVFKVVFRNNYSNDVITYTGPVNGYFIYDPTITTQIITLTSPIVATRFALIDSNGADISSNVTVSNIKGYKASVADINRFRLEYNITDIKGSINPDNVCPSIDKFVENQLSSELIIDAMDYQKKINDEKAKLQSNKDNLLHLLEQQDEINQLSKLIGKINDVNTEREHQTNAINAMQLFKQMNEYSKLKEVLDDRIALRKQNTFDLAVNINKVTEGFEPSANSNGNNMVDTSLAPEDNYCLL